MSKSSFLFFTMNVFTLLVASFSVLYAMNIGGASFECDCSHCCLEEAREVDKAELSESSSLLEAAPARGPKGGYSLYPIIRDVTPSIVNISTKYAVGDSVFGANTPLDPFLDKFFKFYNHSANKPRTRIGVGSGVVVDAEKGYILTNHHVIDKAEQIRVTFFDKRYAIATVVGSDPYTDIALLQVETDSKIQSIRMGDSSSLHVGDFVIAIGSPHGLSNTVTYGIVSALDRIHSGNIAETFIQTDAALNPGNSGGALIDMNGELVGINNHIIFAGGRPGSVGLNFAIPVNAAKGIARQIAEYGEVKRGFIGVQTQNVTPLIMDALDLPTSEGVIITFVHEDTPASRSGLDIGDVVVSVNGVPVKHTADFASKITNLRIGDAGVLGVVREGVYRDVVVQIEKQGTLLRGGGVLTTEVDLLSGVVFKKTQDGVVVLDLDSSSKAFYSGMRVGDLVTSVNQVTVHTTEELFNAAKMYHNRVLFYLRRGESAPFFVVVS